jgi:hypothetical protein
MSNQIHRYWTGDSPKPSSSVLAGRIANGFGELNDWTDATLPVPILDIIDEHINDVPADQQNRHKSNIARYALLLYFGGIWMDHDVVLMSVPARGIPWVASSNGYIVSSIMSFPAGDRHLSKALESLREGDTSYQASGGGMLEEIWTDVHRFTLPWSYEGVRDRQSQPWALHFWASKS